MVAAGQVEVLISHLETVYLICWVSALCLSVSLMVAQPSRYEICTSVYWKFLFQPWKVFTFFVAAALITFVAPYSGDPTWDYPDSVAISCLTYIVAPWSVGVAFVSYRDRKFDRQLFVAMCLFFVPCWFYDIYILFRDHAYPETWISNLFLSGPIVGLAGLFWNLAWRPDVGRHFSFSRTPWLESYATPLGTLMFPALVIAMPVVGLVLWFVYDAL